MVYQKGQYVYYKKYLGKIHSIFNYNKSYMVTLYDYRGGVEVNRQCYQHELFPAIEIYEQISIL